MASIDPIHAAMDHVEQAMRLLNGEMGTTAAESCLMQFCRSVSRRPIDAQHMDASSTAVPLPSPEANVEGTPTTKTKRKTKRSIQKRAERAESHGRWLRQQAEAQNEARKASVEASLNETARSPLVPAVHTAADIIIDSSIPAITAMQDGIQAAGKRATVDAPARSPHTTPTRVPSDPKKPRSQDAPHARTQLNFQPMQMTDTATRMPPPHVALQAQDFARGAISNSQWRHLTKPEYVHTLDRCVHSLSSELVRVNDSEWFQRCEDFGPRILHGQCVADGVPLRDTT